MATLLLTEQPGGSYVTSHERVTRLGVRVRLRARELDEALARGACPDSSAALSLRAHELIGWTARRRLAREIRSLLARAERPIHPMHSSVPICRHRSSMPARPSRSSPIGWPAPARSTQGALHSSSGCCESPTDRSSAARATTISSPSSRRSTTRLSFAASRPRPQSSRLRTIRGSPRRPTTNQIASTGPLPIVNRRCGIDDSNETESPGPSS